MAEYGRAVPGPCGGDDEFDAVKLVCWRRGRDLFSQLLAKSGSSPLVTTSVITPQVRVGDAFPNAVGEKRFIPAGDDDA